MKKLILSIFCIAILSSGFAQLLEMTSPEGRHGLIAAEYGVTMEMKHDSAKWCKDGMFWYAVVGDNGFYNLYHFDTESKTINKIEGEPFTDFSIRGSSLQVNDSLGQLRTYYTKSKEWKTEEIPAGEIYYGVNSQEMWAMMKDGKTITDYSFRYIGQKVNWDVDEEYDIYKAWTDSGAIILDPTGKLLYPYAVESIYLVEDKESAWVVRGKDGNGNMTYGWFDTENTKFFFPPTVFYDDWDYFEKASGEMMIKRGAPYLILRNGKWGLIDKNKNVIIPFDYDELYYCEEFEKGKKMVGLKDGKWIVFNKKLKTIKELKIDSWLGKDYVRKYKKTYGLVLINDKERYIDLKSLEVLDIEPEK